MAEPIFVAASSVANTTGTSLSVDKPAGTSSGNLLILVLSTVNESPTITPPSGFTLLQSKGGGAWNSGMYIYWKLAGGSESSSYTFGFSTANVRYAQAFAFSGVDGTTPIDDSAKSSDQGSVTSIALPSVTASVADTLHIGISFEWNQRSPTLSATGSQTARGGNNAGGQDWFVTTEGIASSGAISGKTHSSSSSGDFVGFSVVVAPSGGGGGGDTTAPTLTSPSGTGGALTCSGSVTTDEGNGTLYAVVTASATAPSKSQVKAGQDHTGTAALRTHSQAVSSTGSKSVPSGSVTSGTRYFHFMHEDAAGNQSAVVTSSSFSVTASGPTIDAQPSNQTVTAPATATFSVSATASGGSLSYQWQRQPSGGAFSDISGATSASYTTGATSVSGGGHNNGDAYRCVVTDSNGSTTSSSATLTVNASGSVSLTSSALKDNTGTLHLSASFEAFVLNVTTGALVVKKTGLTSHASTGVVSFTDASLVSGTQYRVIWRRTDTGAQGVEILTAA